VPDSGSHVIVREWTDIDAAPGNVSGVDKQRVATIFTEQSWDHVVWLPTWLLEDDSKDIETVESSDHLAVGDVTDYSEKAWQFVQPHRDGADGLGDPGGYLPKSQVVVFERADGLEAVDSPQAGLDAFAGGSDA
jgi:hypothetical protein